MTYSDGLYSGKMSSEREKENIEIKKGENVLFS